MYASVMSEINYYYFMIIIVIYSPAYFVVCFADN